MKTLGLAGAGTFLALSLIFCGCKPRIDHGVEFLVAVGSNQVAQITSNDVRRTADILAKRVDKLGCRALVEPAADNRIRVKVDPRSKQELASVRRVLSRSGFLEFRLAHPESAQLANEGIIPAGYTMMKEMRTDASGQKQTIPFIVSKQRVQGLSGRNINRTSVARGNANDPQVTFCFDAEGTAAFAKITTDNVGRQLAIVLDGELYSAPMIRSAITEGSGQISGGNMSMAEALDLAVLLQFPLEVTVQILEEHTF
jgi:SecD/SecF fusion protein